MKCSCCRLSPAHCRRNAVAAGSAPHTADGMRRRVRTNGDNPARASHWKGGRCTRMRTCKEQHGSGRGRLTPLETHCTLNAAHRLLLPPICVEGWQAQCFLALQREVPTRRGGAGRSFSNTQRPARRMFKTKSKKPLAGLCRKSNLGKSKRETPPFRPPLPFV